MENSIIKVLLVDDDEDDYLITSDLIEEIERTKFKMEWCASFFGALEIINQHRHDVYLIDYRLGPHSGLELITKAINEGCNAPMILLTGQGDSEVDIMAMEAGSTDYLVKGQLDSAILERTIRYALQRKRSEDLQSALFKISEATNLSHNLEDLLATIHKVLGTLIDSTNFCVALYDKSSKEYSFPYMADKCAIEENANSILKKSLINHIRRCGKPTLLERNSLNEIIADKGVQPGDDTPLISIGVPLHTAQGINGVVMLHSYTNENLYTKKDLDLLAFVSGHIAMAIERKKSEAEIKDLAKFPSENPNPVLRISSEGIILYANKASLPLLDEWQADIGDAIPEKLHECLLAILKEENTCEKEISFGEKSYAFTFSPAIEQNYINIYAQDISARKQAEKQRKKLQEQLTRAERMESLGVLAGGVAHDLNNILGPLVAYPEIIKMKLPPESPIRDEISKIEKSAQRAADVVQDLLTMARRGRYDMAPLSFNDVVNSYLQSTDYNNLESKYASTNLICKLDENIPRINGSAPHLYKVIMNLVMNACEAMPDGGELIVKTECHNLDRLSSGFNNIKIGDYVILTISDTGHGITKKDQRHLFEPFYTKKKMGSSGSGLGLAIVYGVTKDHNGYIDVISEIGQGTDFILYFPAITNDNFCEKENQTVTDIHGSEKVLVVDDLEDQRELASLVLTNLGYDVHAAANGHEAIEYLRQHDADIIILDMIMEDNFDGLDTYREIIKIKPGHKAIIASGFSATDRVKEAERLGVGKYIRKPYTMQTLGIAIREVLDTPKTRRQETVHA